MTSLTNRSGTVTINNNVTSSIAKEVEVHDHIMDDGIAKTTQIIGLEVGVGESVKMKPHGKHPMLFAEELPKDGGTFSTHRV